MIIVETKNNFKEIVALASRTIQSGGVILMAFDTVYGLVCDPKNDSALEKIFRLKERDTNKTIGTAVSDIDTVKRYCQISQENLDYLDRLTPGKYTFILPALCHSEQHDCHPELVSGSTKSDTLLSAYCYQNGTLAVRIPDNKLVLAIAKDAEIIAQTSANKAGKPNCYNLLDIKNQFTATELDNIDLIIDSGTIENSKPSTLIDLTKEIPQEIER